MEDFSKPERPKDDYGRRREDWVIEESPFLLGIVVLLISVVLYWYRKNVEDRPAARAGGAATFETVDVGCWEDVDALVAGLRKIIQRRAAERPASQSVDLQFPRAAAASPMAAAEELAEKIMGGPPKAPAFLH